MRASASGPDALRLSSRGTCTAFITHQHTKRISKATFLFVLFSCKHTCSCIPSRPTLWIRLITIFLPFYPSDYFHAGAADDAGRFRIWRELALLLSTDFLQDATYVH
jgi:hypothetical protein